MTAKPVQRWIVLAYAGDEDQICIYAVDATSEGYARRRIEQAFPHRWQRVEAWTVKEWRRVTRDVVRGPAEYRGR